MTADPEILSQMGRGNAAQIFAGPDAGVGQRKAEEHARAEFLKLIRTSTLHAKKLRQDPARMAQKSHPTWKGETLAKFSLDPKLELRSENWKAMEGEKLWKRWRPKSELESLQWRRQNPTSTRQLPRFRLKGETLVNLQFVPAHQKVRANSAHKCVVSVHPKSHHTTELQNLATYFLLRLSTIFVFNGRA